jgi:hypothetical protein
MFTNSIGDNTITGVDYIVGEKLKNRIEKRRAITI